MQIPKITSVEFMSTLADLEKLYVKIELLIEKKIASRLDGQNTKLDAILAKLSESTKSNKIGPGSPPIMKDIRYGEKQFKYKEIVKLSEIPTRAWVKGDRKYSRITLIVGGMPQPLTTVFHIADLFKVMRAWTPSKNPRIPTRTSPPLMIVQRLQDGKLFKVEEKYLEKTELVPTVRLK